MTGLDPNKAKTARRVIEVLEFFDEQNRQATVMDIARRYGRPQSSTSELLAILVEMGLLYKDASSRSFMPTPRAAMLGSLFQPNLVRDGSLAMMTHRLSAQTGLGVAVMGMVGLDVQVFRWIDRAAPATVEPSNLTGGARCPLYDSPAGWLLLSTLPPERRTGTLRRLRAEAPADRKFNSTELSETIEACGVQGSAIGPAGFGASALTMCTTLLPAGAGERPMALGFVYEASEAIDPAALVALLQRSVQSCANPAGSLVVDLDERRIGPDGDEAAALFDEPLARARG